MVEPLRVLAVDQGDGVWGAQRYLLRLARGLRDRDIELTLAGPRQSALQKGWRDDGLPAVGLELPTSRQIRTSGRVRVGRLIGSAATVPATARAIAECAGRARADVVWANGHWIHLDTALAGRRAGIPSVLHLHEESIPGIGTRLRALAISLANQTVAVSDAVAAGLPSAVRPRVSVIPNGVDADEYSPGRRDRARRALGLADGEIAVLVVSRLDPCKRIEDVIGAVRDIPGLRLFIAGDTSGFPDYAARVRALADGATVRFLGIRSDMVELFRGADIVLHAGLVEGMPLGLLEAHACGVPVVAYRVAGVPEVVRDGETGFLADPGDVRQLAVYLRVLTSNPSLRAQLGAAARAKVQRSHRFDTQVARNAELLRRLAATPERR